MKWWTGLVACQACGAKHVSVQPLLMELPVGATGVECNRCHAMACVPAEPWPPDEAEDRDESEDEPTC